MSDSLASVKNNPSVNERVQVCLKDLIKLRYQVLGVSLKHMNIRAILSGSYLSKIKGRGMEFDEVRLYMPGDDVRSLDWRVTARTGKPHTKLYREERERPVFLSVDYRSPMFFATQGAFKSVVAAKLAALMAWSSNQHSDRVGGQIFTDHEIVDFKPRRGNQAILHFLKNLADLSGRLGWQGITHHEGGAKSKAGLPATSLVEALEHLNRHAKPGSVIFLISDFRGFNDEAESLLVRIARHCEMVLILVYDSFERELPKSGRYRISNGMRRMTLNASDHAKVAEYSEIFKQRHSRVKTLAVKCRMRFVDFCTTEDTVEILPKLVSEQRRASG